jgi:hypothetical protein
MARLLLTILVLMTALSAPVMAEEKIEIDWVSVESVGTMRGVKGGALERTIWAGQKRSEIEAGIDALPNRQSLRSALDLQRRVLLTAADASLIENDEAPEEGSDLFIHRIKKLMDMGLYDDAWALYTQKAEDPYHVSIAQLGMLLLVMKNDLATACLEEKVLAARYPEDDFFKKLDAACQDVLGGTVPPFENSPVLQAVYHSPDYTVPATKPDLLKDMTDLERALILANGKISYSGLTRDILRDTPSALIALYLMDKTMPEAAFAMVKAEADARGLSWHIPAIAQDPDWKKARDVGKDLEAQWPKVEAALTRTGNPQNLIPWADMIADGTPKDVSTDILQKALGGLLAAGQPLPEHWLKLANAKAPEKPVLYAYLYAFKSLTPTPDAGVTLENLKKAFLAIEPADGVQLVEIVGTIDKNDKTSELLLEIYDKESVLTSSSNYVMPSNELEDTEETAKPAQAKKLLGITVLTALNGLADKPDNMYSSSVNKAIESLLSVGLIEDARLMAAETIAGILKKY